MLPATGVAGLLGLAFFYGLNLHGNVLDKARVAICACAQIYQPQH